MTIDLNSSGEQRSRSLIPEGTVCALHLKVKSGGAGPGGWLRESKDGACQGLDCEFTVIGGQYDRHKIWGWLTVSGKTPGHKEAADIAGQTLRAIFESSYGLRPDDHSEAADKARVIPDWGAFNGLAFMAVIGVKPAQGGYPAKNFIVEVVTPDQQGWQKVVVPPATAGSAAVPSQPAATAAQQGFTRPEWAK
jgi:hypothetical protein